MKSEEFTGLNKGGKLRCSLPPFVIQSAASRSMSKAFVPSDLQSLVVEGGIQKAAIGASRRCLSTGFRFTAELKVAVKAMTTCHRLAKKLTSVTFLLCELTTLSYL